MNQLRTQIETIIRFHKEPDIPDFKELIKNYDINWELRYFSGHSILHMAASGDSQRSRKNSLTKVLLDDIPELDPNMGVATCPLFWAARTDCENETTVRAII